MTFLARAAAVIALLLASAFVLAEDRPIPPLTGRVVDETETLSAEQKRSLEAKLQAFEQSKGSQIAVMITGTTFPEPIESFSIRVADAWKIGRKGVNDGILVVVAKSDRVMRLEVGYGLEGAIPDAVARRLIDEVFIPGFRDGKFYEGLDAGIDRLIKVIDGEPLPEVSQTPAGGRGDPRSLESYFVLFIVATLAVGGVLRRLLGPLPGALVVGAGIGLLAWFIVAPLLVALLVAVVAFVVTLFGGGGRMGGGGFGGGGFGGGGGGGGFSGGGGGFGGGGASGRW